MAQKPIQYSNGTELVDGKAYYQSPVDGKYYVYRRRLDSFQLFGKNPPQYVTQYKIAPPTDANLRPDLTNDGAGATTSGVDDYNSIAGLGEIKPKPLGPINTSIIRYPSDKLVGSEEDYVVFEFVKYNPPFGKDTTNTSQGGSYNASVINSQLEKVKVQIDKGIDTVILPVPQDLSNEMKQNWEGKSFSGLGKAAIGALAGANLSFAADKLKDVGGNLKALQAAVTNSALNAIPGVGGNLGVNDITGATRGIVLNPNAELLYDSPDLREIGMTWKMVPRNATEAQEVKLIVNAFRSASLPQWGSQGAEKGLQGDADQNFADVTFISVPLLCKFTFMTGGKPHGYIAQFKPCAIRQVQVNYTPDGTYATYGKGAPVATELSIQFLETKLIYASEIQAGF